MSENGAFEQHKDSKTQGGEYRSRKTRAGHPSRRGTTGVGVAGDSEGGAADRFVGV